MAQDSDWGYPSGSEVVTICGEDDDRALAPALGPPLGASLTRGAGRNIDPIRVLVWTLTALLALCVALLALAGWRQTAAQTQQTSSSASYPLQIVFGDRGTNAAAPYAANGSESACTDETYDAQSGAWSCAGWSSDTVGLPIEAATPYDGGPCAERRVDQSAGRWVCVQS